MVRSRFENFPATVDNQYSDQVFVFSFNLTSQSVGHISSSSFVKGLCS